MEGRAWTTERRQERTSGFFFERNWPGTGSQSLWGIWGRSLSKSPGKLWFGPGNGHSTSGNPPFRESPPDRGRTSLPCPLPGKKRVGRSLRLLKRLPSSPERKRPSKNPPTGGNALSGCGSPGEAGKDF